MGEQGVVQTRSDDRVVVRYVHRPGCVIEVTVVVSPEMCLEGRQKAIKDARKDVSIPGFRRGHVPDEVLSAHFGPQIDHMIKERVAQMGYAAAIRLIDRYPFSKDGFRKLRWLQHPSDKGAEFFFQYESTPEVPQVNVNDLALEAVQPKQPSEQDVEAFIQKACQTLTKKVPVTDRPVAEGDHVQVTIASQQGEEPTSIDIFVHRGTAPERLIQGLIGMQVGETKEISLSAPNAGQASGEAAKQVTVAAISKDAPVASREALAGVFGLESVDDLHGRVVAILEHDARVAAHERMRRQVRNELIRLYAFDLPQSLIEKETEARFQAYWNATKDRSSPPQDKDLVRKSFLDEVKRQYTCLFLFQPLFEQLDLKYSELELQLELRSQLFSVPDFQHVLYPGLDKEEIMHRLLGNIIVRKCEDYCIQQRLGIQSPDAEQLDRSTESLGHTVESPSPQCSDLTSQVEAQESGDGAPVEGAALD